LSAGFPAMSTRLQDSSSSSSLTGGHKERGTDGCLCCD
jgi:hypothetical protein